MQDLNATMFYKAKFHIAAIEENLDLLWRIVLHIREWMNSKWNASWEVVPCDCGCWTKLKYGGRIFSTDEKKSVYIESECFQPEETEEQYWACRISEKRPQACGVAPRQWVTEIGFEQKDKSSAVLSIVTTYSDQPKFFGPCESAPTATLPCIVRNILEDRSLECTVGMDTPIATPTPLYSGDWPRFWKRLTHKNRELPYIYISAHHSSETAGFLISPRMFANAVCGNALVFYPHSPEFTNEMNRFCPENYACFGGAIRIYMPQLDITKKSDPFQHRYFGAKKIMEYGSEQIIDIFHRALAQDVNFYESFLRIDNCRRLKDEYFRHQRLLEIQETHKSEMDTLKSQSLDVALEEEQKRLKAEEKVALLEMEIEDLKQENFSLSAQVGSFHGASMKQSRKEPAVTNRLEIKMLPQNAESVVDYFAKMFGDRIAFTHGAVKSLKNCTIDPSELWETLYCLATTMHDLLEAGTPQPYAEFRAVTGINCARGEGRMTRKNKSLMQQFETVYKGETVNIEPHITFPRQSQSIHFGFSANEHKIIVGHCGEHLEIYSTAKRR